MYDLKKKKKDFNNLSSAPGWQHANDVTLFPLY